MDVATKIIRVNAEEVSPQKTKQIAGTLRREGVIVYPTETFYGLGASCFSKKATHRIYQLKKRTLLKPISILVLDTKMVREVAVDIPSLFWRLVKEFWPGPLTLVLKASSLLPEEILGPGHSIGLRVPSLPWLRNLLRETSFPITATSANISGEKEISRPQVVIAAFQGRVDLIVDGGETKGISPSTVVDLTSSKPIILREGAIPRSSLERFLAD